MSRKPVINLAYQYKQTRHQPGLACGPRGSQGPSGIPAGHLHRWFMSHTQISAQITAKPGTPCALTGAILAVGPLGSANSPGPPQHGMVFLSKNGAAHPAPLFLSSQLTLVPLTSAAQ